MKDRPILSSLATKNLPVEPTHSQQPQVSTCDAALSGTLNRAIEVFSQITDDNSLVTPFGKGKTPSR